MLPAPLNPPSIRQPHRPAQTWLEREAEARTASEAMGISYARAFHLLREMDRLAVSVA